MNKILYLFSWITICIAVIGLSLFSYWSLCPYEKVLTFQNQPLKIKEDVIHPGDYISTDVSFCKNTHRDAWLSIAFIDGFIYNTPPVISTFDEGCHDIEYFLYVPKAIPEGEYNISATFRYRVNPIREVDVVVVSEVFEVTE